MRYRNTFDVKSHTHLAATLCFTHRDLKFRVVETSGRFTKLIVDTGSVKIPLEALRTPTQGEEPEFAVPRDPFLDVVIEEIRAIRGALALWGVIDIDVDQFLREFVPDTIEENVAMQVKSIKYERWNREKLPVVPNTSDLLIRCVVSRRKLARYEVPLEFYRRGADDSFREQYVEAIFNFFVVFEYLFGEGQFRAAHLVKNFLASSKDSVRNMAIRRTRKSFKQSSNCVASCIIKALSESIGTPRSKRNLKWTHTSSARFASRS